MKEESKIPYEEIKEGAPFAALSYILFLWILGFILKRENQFVHYHAKQGLVLFVIESVFYILVILGLTGNILQISGTLLFLVVSLYGLFSALTGRPCKIPFISNIATKLII